MGLGTGCVEIGVECGRGSLLLSPVCVCMCECVCVCVCECVCVCVCGCVCVLNIAE